MTPVVRASIDAEGASHYVPLTNSRNMQQLGGCIPCTGFVKAVMLHSLNQPNTIKLDQSHEPTPETTATKWPWTKFQQWFYLTGKSARVYVLYSEGLHDGLLEKSSEGFTRRINRRITQWSELHRREETAHKNQNERSQTITSKFPKSPLKSWRASPPCTEWTSLPAYPRARE